MTPSAGARWMHGKFLVAQTIAAVINFEILSLPDERTSSDIDSTITTAAPRCAAASVTAAAPTTASAATAAGATAAASAAAAAVCYLREAAGGIFPIEDVECSKTHVGHFLFIKNEALIGCGIQRLRKVRSRKSGCGCASHQRKTQSGGA
jgi:hypothetical protein